MNVVMAGIDYSTAGIDIRQKYSFTKHQQEDCYTRLLQEPQILGAVFISTCNRTELYLSLPENASCDAAAWLCRLAGTDYTAEHIYFNSRHGQDLFHYLCLLASGAKSQIWGEDQIITQVKEAISFSRENHAADSALEVLFRQAVTAAKRVRTDIRFCREGRSVASRVLSLLEGQDVERVLVIGNGEIGRLVASTLQKSGLSVWMTLRRYRHGEVPIPSGVDVFPYSERYRYLSCFDVLISVTASPHFTVEFTPFAALAKHPSVIMDLAIPRDIDPAIAQLPGILFYDIDSLASDAIEENHAFQVKQAEPVIERAYRELLRWEQSRSVFRKEGAQSDG